MSSPIPLAVPLPGKSIQDVLLRQAAALGDKPAIEFMDKTISYAETAEKARRFASALAALGIQPGDRIGIMLPNLPEFAYAYYGALMAGATLVLYNVMLTPDEIAYLSNDAGIKAMLVLDRFLPNAQAGTKNVESFEHLLVIGETPEGAKNFHALLEQGDPAREPHESKHDDIALLVYTSGTTGKPKGAMLSHHNVLSNLASFMQLRPNEGPQKILCVLPLFHVYGLIALLNMSFIRGGTLLLQPRFEPEPVIDALEKKGVTAFAGTPTMYFHVLNHPASKNATFPKLIRCGCGGAALPVEIRRKWSERFKVDITEGYGLSESTVSLCGYPEGLPIKSGSIGVPNPGVEMKIVDDDGNEVLFGDMGEIVARGPNIMQGYWNKPEETAKALRDGWLYTGDLGYIDHHGYFFIVDRKKDMIIKGGYNIYPREIEEVIYQLPQINMAAVFGIPDEAKGERVECVVSLKPGQVITADAIMSHLREKLAKYKLPEQVIITDVIPTGPTGKILKRELRANWDKIAVEKAAAQA